MTEKRLFHLDDYRRIIYDFNGTLFDDVHLGMKAVNPMLRRRGLPEIATLDDYYALFGFPIEDYYRRLGFDFDKEPYADLAVEWVNSYRAAEKTASLRSGALEFLSLCNERSVEQYVLSATESHILDEQLSFLGIRHYFKEIAGRDDIYAESKLALAKRFHDTHEPQPTLYIGDTDHDAACAEIIGADCILLSGGHQSFEKLKKTDLPVFSGFEEIINCFKAEERKKGG